MQFEIGDRIRVKKQNDGFTKSTVEGSEGTVISVHTASIGVAFDEDINGHGCGHLCQPGHGWWIFSNEYDCIENITNNDAPLIDVTDYL